MSFPLFHSAVLEPFVFTHGCTAMVPLCNPFPGSKALFRPESQSYEDMTKMLRKKRKAISVSKEWTSDFMVITASTWTLQRHCEREWLSNSSTEDNTPHCQSIRKAGNHSNIWSGIWDSGWAIIPDRTYWSWLTWWREQQILAQKRSWPNNTLLIKYFCSGPTVTQVLCD